MKSDTIKSARAACYRFGGAVKLLALAAAAALSVSAQAATKKVNGYNWTYVKVKGGVQIGDGAGVAVSPRPTGVLKIPAKIGSSAVKAIGSFAFNDCDDLTSVTVPNGVTDIGMSTFEGCDNLKTVTMPASVKTYGARVFADCPSLLKAPLPKNLKAIPESGFLNCKSIKSMLTSAGVKNIGNDAFSGCEAFKSIKVAATVTSIGSRAFASCTGLESAMILCKVIGDDAFRNCSSLKYVIMRPGVTTIGVEAFLNCANMEGVILPSSVTTIGADAFKNALKAGDREVRYEVEGDDARLKTLLTGSGYPDVNNLDFWLYCKLTVKPNNAKYGTAGAMDDDILETTMWEYAENGLTLLARPKKGYVFAGWYQDKACKKPIDGDLLYDSDSDYRARTQYVVMPGKHTTVYAKFITKAADKKALKFTSAAKKLAKKTITCYPDSCISLTLPVSSASTVTYSAKGLPAGLSINDETGEIKGSSLKPGSFTVTVTAKSAGGNKVTQKVKITAYADDTAVGTFKGYARFKPTDPAASLTFTVRAKGEVSGKVIFKDKSYPFTSKLSYSTPSMSQFSPSIKIGKTTYKIGNVYICDFENLESTINAQAEDPSKEFCAYKKPGLIVDDGSLADLEGESVELTDEESGANLKVLFQKGDVALVSGTIGGKTVGCSTQLCLRGSYDEDPPRYEVVAPVVLYKNKFYRTLYFTITKDAGVITIDEKEIKDISALNY